MDITALIWEKLKQHQILLLIVLLALVLRVVGLNWGLPFVYHPDESVIIRISALFGTGDFNPHWFSSPTFQMYSTFVLFGIYYVAGVIFGAFSFPPTRELMESIYFLDPTNFFLIGRGLVALYGVATVILIYKFGKLIFNRRVGLISALLLAIVPLHVFHSHFVTLDVTIAFWVLLSLYFAIKVFDSDDLKWYILSGIAAGLAGGTKYGAFIVILGLIGVHLSKGYLKKESLVDAAKSLLDRRIWIGIICAFVVFFAVNPFILLSPSEFSVAVERILATQWNERSPLGMNVGNPLWHYATTLLEYSVGLPLRILIMAGLLYALFIRKKEIIALSLFMGVYLLVISTFDVYFMRYLLLVLPIFLVCAAALIDRAIIWASKDRLKEIIVGIVIAIVIFYTLAYSLALVNVMVEKDTRTIANEWFEENVAFGAKVGIVISPVGMIETDDAPIDGEKYLVIRSKQPKELIAQDVEYLLVSNYDYRQYFRLQGRFPDEAKFYEDLLYGRTNYRRIAEFENPAEFLDIDFEKGFLPHSINTINPKITIFKRN